MCTKGFDVPWKYLTCHKVFKTANLSLNDHRLNHCGAMSTSDNTLKVMVNVDWLIIGRKRSWACVYGHNTRTLLNMYICCISLHVLMTHSFMWLSLLIAHNLLPSYILNVLHMYILMSGCHKTFTFLQPSRDKTEIWVRGPTAQRERNYSTKLNSLGMAPNQSLIIWKTAKVRPSLTLSDIERLMHVFISKWLDDAA